MPLFDAINLYSVKRVRKRPNKLYHFIELHALATTTTHIIICICYLLNWQYREVPACMNSTIYVHRRLYSDPNALLYILYFRICDFVGHALAAMYHVP